MCVTKDTTDQNTRHLSSLGARRIEKSEKRKGSCVLQMFLNQLNGLLEGGLLPVGGWGEGAEAVEEGRGAPLWDETTGGGTVTLGGALDSD